MNRKQQRPNGGVSLTELPRVVADARMARGLSLRDAALESGVSFATLSRIEGRAEFVTDTRTLQRIATWLCLRIVIPPNGEAR